MSDFGFKSNSSKQSLQSKITHAIQNIGISSFELQKEYVIYESVKILKNLTFHDSLFDNSRRLLFPGVYC